MYIICEGSLAHYIFKTVELAIDLTDTSVIFNDHHRVIYIVL